MAQIRTFIAIEIPQSIKDEIAKFQNELKRMDAHISWVKPNNMHITLRFLGNIDEGKIENIANAMDTAAKQISDFSIEITGVGAFPNFKRPRVIWIGGKSAGNLLGTLAQLIDQELHKLSYAKENRPFKTHLTLGRVKSQRGIGEVIDYLKQNEDINAGNFVADEIVLIKSELKPTGAVYTPLKRISFNH